MQGRVCGRELHHELTIYFFEIEQANRNVLRCHGIESSPDWKASHQWVGIESSDTESNSEFIECPWATKILDRRYRLHRVARSRVR